MKLSASTSYAIVAAIHLAKNQGDGCIMSATIAKEYNIPYEYCLKILQQLVRANIVASKRGPRGGFRFVDTKATVLDVIHAVEGPSQICDMQDFGVFRYPIAEIIEESHRRAEKHLGTVKLTDF